jgi:hypothetical protein
VGNLSFMVVSVEVVVLLLGPLHQMDNLHTRAQIRFTSGRHTKRNSIFAYDVRRRCKMMIKKKNSEERSDFILAWFHV